MERSGHPAAAVAPTLRKRSRGEEVEVEVQSAAPSAPTTDESRRRLMDYFCDGEGPEYLTPINAVPAAAPSSSSTSAATIAAGGGDVASDGGGSSVPFLLTPAMPQAAYRSRGTQVKSTIHWGQRKLLMCELQLLTHFCEPHTSHWIVYVGAAPGSHLLFLDSLFPSSAHHWELIDPGAWDNRLTSPSCSKRFTLRNEYFSNAAAYELATRRLVRAKCPALSALYGYGILSTASAQSISEEALCQVNDTLGTDANTARTSDIPIMYEEPLRMATVGVRLLLGVASERCKMLFLSDIRSGREDNGNFEEHVAENSRAQEAWTDIINPTYAMLKFRLPYTYTSRWSFEEKRQIVAPHQGPPATLHCGGHVMLPLWTRQTSTETRLIVPQNVPKRMFDHAEYENQMFFFNSVLREQVHFDHVVEGHKWLDHRFDASGEVATLTAYLRIQQPTVRTPSEIASEVVRLSDSITEAIGGSFERAIANRDNINIGKGKRAGWLDEVNKRLLKAQEKRDLPIWHRRLDSATERPAPNAQPYVWNLVAFAPKH